jgi:hypothetical protein
MCHPTRDARSSRARPEAEPALRYPVDTSSAGRDVPAEVLRFATLPEDRRRLLLHVDELLSEIAYGNVVIVLQDGKVIQIETSEKIRLR